MNDQMDLNKEKLDGKGENNPVSPTLIDSGSVEQTASGSGGGSGDKEKNPSPRKSPKRGTTIYRNLRMMCPILALPKGQSL